MGKRALVIARTGDVENAPENTRPAFESAIARGAHGVELDVHLTADGELIVHHFYGLGATDDGTRLVCEHTLAELKALDSGAWFNERFAGEPKPTLCEVFQMCKGRVGLEIDMKDTTTGFLRQVIDVVDRFELTDDVELTSPHSPLLPEVKRLNPHLRTGAFFYRPPEWMPIRLAHRYILDWARLLEIDVVHLNLALIRPDFVHELHQRGLIVHGSNLDSEDEIERGLSLGVDQLSTGHLGMALQLRNKLASASP